MTVSGVNMSILRHNNIDKSFARERILTLGHHIDWSAGSLIIKAIPLPVLTGLVSSVYTSAIFVTAAFDFFDAPHVIVALSLARQ